MISLRGFEVFDILGNVDLVRKIQKIKLWKKMFHPRSLNVEILNHRFSDAAQ